MTTKNLRRGAVLAALSLAAAAVPAIASDLWLHVRVDEAGGARVKVNLPVSMIEKAIPMIPQEHLRHGRVHFDNQEMSIAELRELWQELKNSPDMTFVTVEESDESVRVWKEEGYLRVEARDSGDDEDVTVRVPLTVVDALLTGEGDELNLRAAMDAMAQAGEGELVTVTGKEDRVRVWVDRTAEAE